ncbi:hypothetical protein DAPPUDRAFT_346702 [Daphnia pulex]|uniref:Uncharacterized protein n=1 Tax=Daphnia pulex TaxID=6669 RepID=E9I807_DAPPU|nr:hypothetical protein DAPPUDRAFT_346702 [Daphnia pulex]|eukprot:EFX59872.1 hypothetical protein DAPPUDRAFT_346702 [Daphnia pulex]
MHLNPDDNSLVKLTPVSPHDPCSTKRAYQMLHSCSDKLAHTKPVDKIMAAGRNQDKHGDPEQNLHASVLKIGKCRAGRVLLQVYTTTDSVVQHVCTAEQYTEAAKCN